MKNLLKINELISKIRAFNEAFCLDIASTSAQKKWNHYLDPIAKKTLNSAYLTFIRENRFMKYSTPGLFEQYFNFFKTVVTDLEILTPLEIPNQIYYAAMDVMETFNNFLRLNNFKVHREKELINGYFVYKYHIFPII